MSIFSAISGIRVQKVASNVIKLDTGLCCAHDSAQENGYPSKGNISKKMEHNMQTIFCFPLIVLCDLIIIIIIKKCNRLPVNRSSLWFVNTIIPPIKVKLTNGVLAAMIEKL